MIQLGGIDVAAPPKLDLIKRNKPAMIEGSRAAVSSFRKVRSVAKLNAEPLQNPREPLRGRAAAARYPKCPGGTYSASEGLSLFGQGGTLRALDSVPQ